MREALQLARLSSEEGEVPVGCVIVLNDRVVGKGRNRREFRKNALHHAELEAIDDACKNLGGWRLWQCEMYVTLEPCPMCAGAIINARIPKVYFGASDKKGGALGGVMDLFSFPFNHKPEIAGGLMEEECSAVLKDFFKSLRSSQQ
jgi:tRNA(adenine34) deaminase